MKFFPHVIAHAIGFTAALCTTSHTVAQTFPVKPIRIIVPATPGGGTDILSRLLSPKLTEYLGQSMVIENRAGASTNIGTEFVARSAPDGYTVLMATTPHAINPSLFTKLSFDPLRDFTMISQLALTQNVLLTHPSLPVNNVKEFVALAKARPGQLTAGTSGGTSAFLAIEMLRAAAKIDVLNIPYKGAGPGVIDVMAGHVPLMSPTIFAALPHVRSGRLRGLAVTMAKRASGAPDIPTLAEAGVKGFDVSSWYGIYAPAGLPRELVQRLNAAFNEALRTPEIRDQLSAQGWAVTGGTPEQFGAFARAEQERWATVVKTANVRVE